jgi:selenocysteine lyase/cysteine desulfurase
MIGALNAGSNITGVLTNTNAFSALLHKYDALAFWDYAAAAPYVKIDMNPPNNELAYKDGVYFSMHKFVGGPDSPGVHNIIAI